MGEAEEEMMQSSEDIKLILFDIGNVLIRYNSKKLCENLSAFCGDYYIPMVVSAMYKYLFNFGVFTRLEKGELCVNNLYSDIKNRFHLNMNIYDFVKVWTKELRLDQEVNSIMHTLSSKYTIGILSNIDIIRYKHIVSSGMLDTDIISHIFVSCHMGMVKPDIRIANYVSSQSGFQKHQILFIDDKEVNVNSMQAEGICSVQYSNPMKLQNDLKEMGIEL